MPLQSLGLFNTELDMRNDFCEVVPTSRANTVEVQMHNIVFGFKFVVDVVRAVRSHRDDDTPFVVYSICNINSNLQFSPLKCRTRPENARMVNGVRY